MELSEQKRTARKSVARLRDAGGWNRRIARAAGRAAAALLAEAPEFRDASRVALFASLPDEIDTRAVFERARSSGTPCLFPRVRPGGALEFAEVASWDDLRPGRYGVREPPGEPAPRPLGGCDLVLVPGVAFDISGRRLGRGKGFYDRAFADRPAGSPRLFGFAAEFQLLSEVPAGPLDRRVDAVVTERGLYRCDSDAVTPAVEGSGSEEAAVDRRVHRSPGRPGRGGGGA